MMNSQQKGRTPVLRLILAGVTCATFAAPLWSGELPSLTQLLGADATLTSTDYTCDKGGPMQVRYINSSHNNLAIVPVDGVERIFVNVMSGSGARYVSGQFEWWTKGNSATLRDEMANTSSECSGK